MAPSPPLDTRGGIVSSLLALTCVLVLASCFRLGIADSGDDADLGEGDGDADTDADGDADSDGDADGDADTDADSDGDADGDGDADADRDADGDEAHDADTSCDECPRGARRCFDTGTVEHCGDHDEDGCAEWDLREPCITSEICEEGACVDRCPDDCDEGDRICWDHMSYQMCLVASPPSCNSWSPPTPCGGAGQCEDGLCI